MNKARSRPKKYIKAFAFLIYRYSWVDLPKPMTKTQAENWLRLDGRQVEKLR
jgi:hypothetical protein